MAIKKRYTTAIPVQLEKDWRDRVQRVADDERVNLSMAQVIRDCIITALPAFELQLGFIDGDDDEVAEQIRAEQEVEPVKEDRSAGCAWGPPLAE